VRWRPLTLAERQLSWVWAGLALAAVALRPLWDFLAPHLGRCTFRSLTGIPCPTCGATRGVLALLHHHPGQAFLLNPLVASGTVILVVGGLLAPLWAWRRGTVPVLETPLPRWLRMAAVLVILANWGWVILTQTGH